MDELKNIMDIFFSPTRFIERATSHSLRRELERNSQFRETHKSMDLIPGEVQQKFMDNESFRVAAIRRSFGAATFRTFAAVLCGIIAGFFIPTGPSWLPLSLQLLGLGFILLVTLAFLGWEIQSYKGDTLPEEVNKSLFRSAYWLGTFLIAWGTVAAAS